MSHIDNKNNFTGNKIPHHQSPQREVSLKKVGFGLFPAGLQCGTIVRALLYQASTYLVNLDINSENSNKKKLNDYNLLPINLAKDGKY